jgi:hypothetical protein
LAALGSIEAGQELSIARNGMAMSLNNDHDEIRLIDPSDVVRDRFAYDDAREGEWIQREP